MHFDLFWNFPLKRWHWSTKTYGRNSTSTALRWSSPSLAGESMIFFLLLHNCNHDLETQDPEKFTFPSPLMQLLQFMYISKLTQLIYNSFNSCMQFNQYTHSSRSKSVADNTRPFWPLFCRLPIIITATNIIESTHSVLVVMGCPRPHQDQNEAMSSLQRLFSIFIVMFILIHSRLLWAIIIIPNGVVSVSERTKPAIKIASFLPGFILMRAKR